jgi:UPF0755 protein
MKIHKILLGIAGLVALLGLGIAGYAYTQFQPVVKEAQPVRKFVIPKGQAVGIIADRLEDEGIIKNALLFRLYVKQNNLQNKIQAGTFEVAGSMPPQVVALTLTKGTNDIWVTIQEGWRTEEIAEYLDEIDLSEFDKNAFLQLAGSDEGYLYPDTYLLPKMATAETIYSLLKNTFERKIEVGLADEIEASKRPLEEVIILASILEREARGYEEMRQVAGVLENRLKIGMALQVDASLQYLKGYNQQQDDWWVPPTAADKSIESPYNTYLNPGLPPTPIANPGLDAIRAALDPAENDNLFYIHDLEGGIHYGKTLEEHNQNVNKYLR